MTLDDISTKLDTLKTQVDALVANQIDQAKIDAVGAKVDALIAETAPPAPPVPTP